ncbi:MAG: hypothetical protein NZM10_06705, partial [Fimbriimonadales bacterium]|nr:hypothetical protein [Fimbriimonadales bacterium]
MALLPDSAANPLWQLREDFLAKNAPLGALEQHLAQWEWIEGAVLIAKPCHATHLWGKRAQRNALKPLIEQVQRRGHPDLLEDEMRAATIAPDCASYRAVSWWLRAHGVETFREPDRIALVRGISPPLWNRLIAGEIPKPHALWHGHLARALLADSDTPAWNPKHAKSCI